MAFDPNQPMEAYVCFAKDPLTSDPQWLLMLMSVGAEYGTLYHSTGGPAHNKPYQVTMEAHRSFSSSGIVEKQLLGPVESPRSNVTRVTGAALRIPAQHSQKYMVGLIAHLEELCILPEGNAKWLDKNVQMNKRDWEYERENPVRQRDNPFPTYTLRHSETIDLLPQPRGELKSKPSLKDNSAKPEYEVEEFDEDRYKKDEAPRGRSSRLGSPRLGSPRLRSSILDSDDLDSFDLDYDLDSYRLGSSGHRTSRLDAYRFGSSSLGSSRLGSSRLDSYNLDSSSYFESSRIRSSRPDYSRFNSLSYDDYTLDSDYIPPRPTRRRTSGWERTRRGSSSTTWTAYISPGSSYSFGNINISYL